jgi:hypothetical protein
MHMNDVDLAEASIPTSSGGYDLGLAALVRV